MEILQNTILRYRQDQMEITSSLNQYYQGRNYKAMESHDILEDMIGPTVKDPIPTEAVIDLAR
jgi:hypothetical protein